MESKHGAPKRRKNPIGRIFCFLILIALIACVGILIWYKSGLKPLSKEENKIIVEIPEKSSISSIANILEENKIIKSATIMKIYCKLNKSTNLQAGKYELDTQEDLKTIISHIENGEIYDESATIAFIEGKTIKDYAKQIAAKTDNTEEDVFNLLKDEEYLDSLIEKYWFITDEIKNEEIYFPLEGYILPDTYKFEKDMSVKEIFSYVLNYMDKYLSKYKDDIESKFTVHQMLTLASIAEKEAYTLDDRKEVIGVFFNRLRSGYNLGSDVTTYYAFQVNMAEEDLTYKQLNTYNPYNTRGPDMIGKIPIGPICNPSKSAIEATIYYTETDNIFFVADKNGKVYFSKTQAEHDAKIKELKDNDLWFTYE